MKKVLNARKNNFQKIQELIYIFEFILVKFEPFDKVGPIDFFHTYINILRTFKNKLFTYNKL